MNRHRLVLVAIVLIGLVACRPDTEQPESSGTVPIRTVWHGIQCRSDEAKIEAITNDAELAKWWLPRAGMQYPAKPLPPKLGAIDFDESVVFAVFMGSRPTAGYDIKLHDERAPIQRTSLTIPATWQVPPGDRMLAQVTTSPCIVVAVPAQRYERVTVRDENGGTLLTAVF